MEIYIVTAFGPMIDTICKAFTTKNKAMDYLNGEFEKMRSSCEHFKSEVVVDGVIWNTEDSRNQNIEWEIHRL